MAVNDSRYLQLDHLLDNLQIEQLDTCLFRGFTKVRRLPRVFGGQVLAQAVNAASRTVNTDRLLHSFHAYFLRAGDPDRAIIYDVDPIRDGGSFTTRRVVAKQNGKAIFNASMSFHCLEEGLEHQMEMPEVPGPENLQSEKEFWESLSGSDVCHMVADLGQFEAIDVRLVKYRDPVNPVVEEPVQGMWIKSRGFLTDDLSIHRMLLAYISDMQFMGTSLLPHAIRFWSPEFQGASLDHTMWFHSDFRVDQWLYYHMDSPRSTRCRGFNRGSFYTKDGCLVASAAQEGLMRLRNGSGNTSSTP
jgi:acyl-CoA thioesterase II